MWLIPLLFLLAPDCPPCVCEAVCDGLGTACKVTTGSQPFDPTALILQVQQLEYEVSQLQAQGTYWTEDYKRFRERLRDHTIYQRRLARWEFYANGPGIPLVAGQDIDEDGDGDGDLKDLALAMRTGGER